MTLCTRRVTPRVSVFLLLIGCLSVLSLRVHAQAPSADAHLAAGIGQIKDGDLFKALLTLNDAVDQLSGRPDQAAVLARTRAYQALAYTLLGQPERAKGFAHLALTADPNIVIDTAEFTPAVAALFDDVRRPATQDHEAAGDAADEAGHSQEAFLAYLRAFQALPEPPAPAADQRLREKVIRVVQKLGTKPLVPQEARNHLTKAQDLVDAEAILGSTAGTASQRAATELRHAIRLAPWWSDAMFRFATVLQKLQRGDEALLNLSLYRVADPEGYAAMIGRATPKNVADRSSTTAADAKPVRPAVVPLGPAVIYVYWPGQARGGGRPKLLCDGQRVADLNKNHFIVLRTTAGTHTITFRDKAISAAFEAGHDHYIRVSAEGYPVHAVLRVASPDEGAAEMREKQTSPNETKKTYSTECKAVSARLSPRKGS